MSEKRITIQDIDGDGFVDVLERGNDNGKVIAKLNKVGKTNYLKQVNTPLGGSWVLDYEREGNTYDLPNNKYVLSKIVTHDGFEADNDYGPDQTLTTITYDLPQYDRREREFLGFGSVKVNQNDPSNESTYRYSLTEYHNENVYLKGLTKSLSSHENDGIILNVGTTLFNIMSPENPETNLFSSDADQFLQAGVTGDLIDYSRLFVAPVKTVSTKYENDESLSVEEHFIEYDEHGNLKIYKNLGDIYNSVPGADVFKTEIDYYPSISGVGNGVGFTKEVRVINVNDNMLLRKRQASYFKGKTSEVKVQLNDLESNVTTLSYNDFGNLTSRTLANEFTTTVGYENILHSYPITISNTHGYTSSVQYNYLFGIPVLNTDINGQEFRKRIDNR